MKNLFFILFILIGCNSVNYKASDCIQKPDSPFVWKILSLDQNKMTITNQTTREESSKEESLSNDWLKTNCLY